MIKINIRDKNNIVTLDCPGKSAIRGRTSASMYFHTPIELLESALGLCVGGNVVQYCRFNDINSKIFEELSVMLDQHHILVNIKRPKNFDKKHEERLKTTIKRCLIAKELVKDIKVVFNDNEIPLEELIKEQPKGCCGG